MEWRKEILQGEQQVTRWFTRVPGIGMFWVEHAMGRMLNALPVWRVVCHPLNLRQDLVAESEQDAQRQATDAVRARLVEALEALSV